MMSTSKPPSPLLGHFLAETPPPPNPVPGDEHFLAEDLPPPLPRMCAVINNMETNRVVQYGGTHVFKNGSK